MSELSIGAWWLIQQSSAAMAANTALIAASAAAHRRAATKRSLPPWAGPTKTFDFRDEKERRNG